MRIDRVIGAALSLSTALKDQNLEPNVIIGIRPDAWDELLAELRQKALWHAASFDPPTRYVSLGFVTFERREQ